MNKHLDNAAAYLTLKNLYDNLQKDFDEAIELLERYSVGPMDGVIHRDTITFLTKHKQTKTKKV